MKGMEFSLVEVGPADRPVLRRLIELYRYDFSEFDRSDVGPHGEFGYPYLDHYWTEPGRHPFLVQVEGTWAGFALVREIPPFDMAEFFVMRKYRRSGLGREVALEIFRRFPGRWQVRELRSNPGAIAFWRTVIPSPYTERVDAKEIVQEFASEP
jgi:predicted acetyltransferase